MTDQDTGFRWGVATAAHQVEGGLDNDWTRWERENAEQLAAEAAAEYSALEVWDDVQDRAEDPDNYISGRAVDQYHRYEQDIELAAELGVDTYRFSIEWSRIEPEPGEIDRSELEHYQDVVDTCREHGIEPVVTLWHFTSPGWFSDMGGWLQDDAPGIYASYVETVVDALGDDVDTWITLNEPVGYAYHTRYTGSWLEEDESALEAVGTVRNLAQAHREAYDIIEREQPGSMVGTANNVTCFEPASDGLVDRVMARIYRELEHGAFLRATWDRQDFVGVNYYMHRMVDGRDWQQPGAGPNSDMGWELSPDGLGQVLRQLGGRGKPVFITEHGLADREDELRAEYIEESVDAIREAMEDGVDVMGYTHWSLLDNVEWDKGRWPRFGLIEVDHDDGLERSFRDSAHRYADIIEEGI